MNKYLLLILIISNTYAQSNFENCTVNRIYDVLRNSRSALIEIAKFKEKLRDRISKEDETLKKLGLINALNILKCSEKKLPKLNYICTNTYEEYEAQTWPVIGTEVKLSNGFFDRWDQLQISALIHESTHKCGTNDLDYFSLINKPRSIGISHWSFIASTYSYWMNNGFCIPKDDC